MRERDAIVLIFAALVTRELWILLPDISGTFDPFPFAEVQITWDTYIYFACFYVSMMILAYAFLHLMTSYQTILTVWFFLQTIELIDYFLTYNTAWFHIGPLGVSITLVKFVALAFIIIYTWTKK